MANTSCSELAERLLACCLKGERPLDDVLDKLISPACSDALFRVVVEGLADRFEPRLCDAYAELFSEVIERSLPELKAADLLARYARVRWPRKFRGDGGRISTVFVLSRVTLGADVAITSVFLDAVRRRFPKARIVLVGSQKSWELFAGERRVAHAPVLYRRAGSVHDRLAPWQDLKRLLAQPECIVIDPDSRLTQLGLLPVCAEDSYYFFESRGYGAEGEEALPALAARWAAETFESADAAPWVAPAPAAPLKVPGRPLITMSLGVGENPAKRIADPFEEELVSHVAKTGAHVLIDEGAGGEEAERVQRAIARSGAAAKRVRTFRGPFATFASAIARSNLYVGYDSAGGHVAAACGVPLVSIFAGFASPRFFNRWRPTGRGKIEVVRVEQEAPHAALERSLEALRVLI